MAAFQAIAQITLKASICGTGYITTEEKIVAGERSED